MRRHLCVCRDLEGPVPAKIKSAALLSFIAAAYTLKIRPPAFMDVLSSGCSNGKTSLCNSTSVTSRQKKTKKKQDKLKLWGKKVQLAFIKWNLNFLIGAESAVGMDLLSSGLETKKAFSRQI